MSRILLSKFRAHVTNRAGLVAFVCAAMLVYGCSSESSSEVEEQQTLAHVMDPLLNDASEVFWDSAGFIDTYEGTIDLTPTTDEGWQKVLDAADEITRLSAVLQEERYSLNRPGWNALSEMLVGVAERGRQSVTNRDGAELFQVGADLYQVCVACHQSFWSNNRFTITDQ